MSSTNSEPPEPNGISTTEPPGSEADDELTDGVAEVDLPGVEAAGETLAPQSRV
jgi:hypothetical protein